MPRPAQRGSSEVPRRSRDARAIPIDPAFVRDFQKSTLAQTGAVGILRDGRRGELEGSGACVEGGAAAISPRPTSRRHWRRSRYRRCWYGVTVTPSPGANEQDALVGAIAGSRLVIYAGAGHSPHWEEPHRFAGQIASFMKTWRCRDAACGSRRRCRRRWESADGPDARSHVQSGEVPPLTVAVWKQQTDDVRRLLQEGADPNHAFGKPALTPWQVAVMVNHQPSLDLFASHGAMRPKSALHDRALQGCASARRRPSRGGVRFAPV